MAKTYVLNKNPDSLASSKPKCLVLLSSFNGEKYIEEQIDSIINQEKVETHVLIRDDGSKDNTIKIIEQINHNNHDIQIIKGENKGIHESFADLITNAPKGFDYYLFADQDDCWDKDKVISTISLMNECFVPFGFGSARLVDGVGNELNKTTCNPTVIDFYMNSNHKIMTPGVQGCTMILSKDFFEFIRCTDYPRYYGHDTWIPIVASYFFGSVYNSIPKMSYRQHDSSWTGNREKKLKQFKKELIFFLKGLERYSDLATDIYKRYKNKLSLEEQGYLIGLFKKGNFINRIINICKYHYSKNTKAKTVVYWIYYLFS